MPNSDELTKLTRDIATAQRERGPRNRFDDGLRERILRFACARLDDGQSRAAVARTLGLSRKTLDSWMNDRRDTSLVPKVIPVVLEPARPQRLFTLELGAGRVSGLELEDIAELVRRVQ